jgi:hypothetical protein
MKKETTTQHLSRHDREIAAIRKLIIFGTKHFDKRIFTLDRRIDKLTQVQLRTEQALNKFIQSMNKGNGKH